MQYVYGCKVREHPRVEVIHGMNDNPYLECEVCHGPMHRIPQPFRFYHNPGQVLLDKLTERFVDYHKAKKYGIQRKYPRGAAL